MNRGLLDDYRQMAGLLGDYSAYAGSLSPYELAMSRAPRGQQEGLLGKVGKALYDTAKRRIEHPVKSYMEDNLGTIMALNPHMPSLWEMNPEMRQAELDTVAMKPGLLGDIAGPVADVNRYAANPDKWTALDTGLAGLGALPFIPALGGITVFHGSPHKFDKFSLEHIGKGEGAQAYGHGLYFAENPEVADIYRKNLTTTEKYVAGKPFDAYNPEHYLASILDQESGNVDETINFLEMMSKRGGSKSIKETANNSLKLLLEGKRPVLGSIKPEGNFYKADIPDEAVANMLDWDAPIKSQSKVVQDGIRQILKDGNYLGQNDNGPRQLTSAWKAFKMEHGGMAAGDSGETLYHYLDKNLGGREQASEYLRSIGIPGIKYYDGMSRAGGKGTRNFVVFDENLITPISRNDEPLGLLNE